MFTLATDVQKIIMEFLEPEEIKDLYETCKDAKIMFNELTKHTNFIIDCKRIMLNEEIQWFDLNNIRLKLLETYKLEYEDQLWYKNGLRHRDNDFPAVVTRSGILCWYKNGECHRDNDLPAVIYPSGTKFWYQNGKIHSDKDLPAVIRANGDQHWYKNGEVHRDNNMPAIIYSSGTQSWYQNGVQYFPN
jgi:hypothetical protein